MRGAERIGKRRGFQARSTRHAPQPTPPVQTTKDEWIQLVRGKTADDHTFDNAGNWNRGSVVVYKFCDIANGQNKAIYSIQNGFVGFELKDFTLLVFANNQGNSGVSPWSSSNDVSFDSNNPDVYTTYTTLYTWRENNMSAQGQAWIQKYKDKTLTSQQNNAKQFTINSDGNMVEQGQSNPDYLFSYIDDMGHLYFRSASSANEYYGAVIKDNIFTWYSLKPGSYYPHPVWYNASDVIFDASLPLVHTENFSIN